MVRRVGGACGCGVNFCEHPIVVVHFYFFASNHEKIFRRTTILLEYVIFSDYLLIQAVRPGHFVRRQFGC
jgi:hypothetical protein